MNSEQILDLFSVGPGKEEEVEKPKADKVATSKEVIQNLEALWDEKEYDDFEVDEFLKGL